MLTSWSFPTKISFGPGAIRQIADAVRDLKIRRPLVVTDPGVVRCGLLDRLKDPLNSGGFDWVLFDKVEGNPTEASVFPGIDVYRSERCDGIIAMGGGSAIDAAKA